MSSGNKYKKYENMGLTGLANVGNTCYLNSCVQVLSHTYELNDLLDNEEYKKNLNEKPESILLLEWDKLRKMMWSRNCIISPMGFVKAVQKVSFIKKYMLFTGHGQNDVQEFLLFMIDCFHTGLSREVLMDISGNIETEKDKMAKVCYEMMNKTYKKDYSEIIKLFYGIHVSVISSIDEKQALSLRAEPFSVLSLSIPDVKNEITIFDCLDYYCKKETLEGDNAWYNDETKKKQDVKRFIKFWNLPNILIMDIKRWDLRGRKINKIIKTPLVNVDFSKYVSGYNPKSYVYDLYGICNHSGNSMGGHYTAYIKNANNKWYLFNDTNIKEENDDKHLITDKTYCLFYRKK